MFRLLKDDQQLSFTVEREDAKFGDGSRVLFWIDMELRMLQRGRQEYIPIDSVDAFVVSGSGELMARMGSEEMVLYDGSPEQGEELNAAADELNQWCGLQG